MIDKILRKIYSFYKYNIHRKLNHIRGSTRILIILRGILLRNSKRIDKEPKSIFQKDDWQNLIILDACRHDIYEEVNGSTKSRITLGSSTPEFISRTFSEGNYGDIVYITANPHFYNDVFKDLTGRNTDIFHSVFNTYENKWDEEKGVVLPESVVEDALTAEKLFPEKRKIIHFMQPHDPYLTSDIQQSPNRRDKENIENQPILTEMERAETREIKSQKVWRDYQENLELVMEHVETLKKELSGKTIVTADHGDLINENGVYGHPSGSELEKLRKVPWDVITK